MKGKGTETQHGLIIDDRAVLRRNRRSESPRGETYKGKIKGVGRPCLRKGKVRKKEGIAC